jgi:hypothetical protein
VVARKTTPFREISAPTLRVFIVDSFTFEAARFDEEPEKRSARFNSWDNSLLCRLTAAKQIELIKGIFGRLEGASEKPRTL